MTSFRCVKQIENRVEMSPFLPPPLRLLLLLPLFYDDYYSGGVRCTWRAYPLNIAARTHSVSLNPRLSVTESRLKVRP